MHLLLKTSLPQNIYSILAKKVYIHKNTKIIKTHNFKTNCFLAPFIIYNNKYSFTKVFTILLICYFFLKIYNLFK